MNLFLIVLYMYNYNYEPYEDDDRLIKFSEQRKPSNLGFNYNNEFKNIRIDKIDGRLLDNIVEYNKNLTPDEVNGTNVNNILKYDNLMTVSEFDKMLIAKQYQKLYDLSNGTNEKNTELYENGKLSNLSLNEISYNFSNVFTDIINEFPTAYKNGKLKEIFTKDDRLIYVGFFMILLSLFFYFISFTK